MAKNNPRDHDPSKQSAHDNSKGAKKPLLFRCFDAITAGDDNLLKQLCAEHLKKITELFSDHLVLILFDDESISDYHADRLYAAASKDRDEKRPILLIVHSPGGSIEPAYLISKALTQMSGKNFKVAVPRRAKSAATLLALGANEIHMGLMSQLGPIDPQFNGLPALALENSLEVIAGVTCRFPGSTEMFTKYLAEQIPIRHLGYFQRINESAMQYAERLLSGKTFPDRRDAKGVANHLVNHYKDHSFVIDANEAKDLLGGDLVKQDTPEYQASDEVFKFLDIVQFFLDERAKRFFWVGSTDEEGANIWPKPTSTQQSPTKAAAPR